MHSDIRMLITASRQTTPSMRAKLDEVVDWMASRGNTIIVGDAPGGDEQVRRACERFGLSPYVYGAKSLIRQPEINSTREQRVALPGGYLARDRVMAQRCDRGLAVMLAPSTRGTWYTGTFVESLGKRMRWAVWDDVAHTWSFYDQGKEIPVVATAEDFRRGLKPLI